jgi:formamidopyrimidine-DNA glycosylase
LGGDDVPEYPDICLYVTALEQRILGEPLQDVHPTRPSVVRTVEPPLGSTIGRTVRSVRRLGKCLVIEVDGSLFLVINLMSNGRLSWRARGARSPARSGLVAFDFPHGSLLLEEVSPRPRASLHVAASEAELAKFSRGGREPLDLHVDEFAERVRRENHTLKRALVDPRLFLGLGSAYADEILHRAQLSPVKPTRALSGVELARLYSATRSTLEEWRDRLDGASGGAWPEDVTAFRLEMAVHGKFGLPCPTCGTLISRIVYGEGETDYCARCQTAGRQLTDRATSRLLRADWPKSPEDLDEYVASRESPL